MEQRDVEQIHVHHFIHYAAGGPLEAKLDNLTRMFERFVRYEKKEDQQMSVLMDELLLEVEAGTTVDESILTLVEKLAANAGDDPVKFRKAINDLRASRDKIGAAVLKHTPQEPPPAP